jgi:6,7-dimethyl-8-ribityllumazine synthase
VKSYKNFEGNLLGEGLKFGIIVARFNDFITAKLLDGAQDGLIRHGVAEEDVEVTWVPGSFEIPLVAQRLAGTKRYDAIICLGAVIRGGTPHFEYVASEVTKGIAQVSLNSNMPVIYGVLTCDTIEQAIERAGTKQGNEGSKAALTAIEMVNLLNTIE